MAIDQAALAESHRITTALNSSVYAQGNEAISALYSRPATNHRFLNPQEYLYAAIELFRPYFNICGVELPTGIHVSDSAPTAKRKPEKDNESNSRLVGNLVQVWLNSQDNYTVYIANQLDKTSEILSRLVGALVLCHVGLVPTAKFPDGELTFKSDQFDIAAKKVGITNKFRGNKAEASATLMENIIRIRDALGDCPIVHIDTVVQRSGLKQTATNKKAVCENEKCSALQLKDDNGKSYPFNIPNISKFWADQLEATSSALCCPFCKQPLAIKDPKAEKAAKKAEAASNVITLNTATPAPEAPASTSDKPEEQATSEAPSHGAQREKPMPKMNRQGKNR